MDILKPILTEHFNNKGSLLFIECTIPYLEMLQIIESFVKLMERERIRLLVFNPDADDPAIEIY